MKKTLSFALALCMAVVSLFSGMTVFADTTKPTTTQIKEKITGAADYIAADDAVYTVNNAVDFLTFIKSGKDMSKYKEAFVQSVKENLDANQAKLMETRVIYDENYNPVSEEKYESPALYGAVILVLDALGYDFTSFYGYNLASSFAKVDLTKITDNPYYYRITLEGAERAGLDKMFKTAVCNDLINSYYKLGFGMDYYGYGCDNTAQFIVALAPYYNDYKATVDDALKLLEAYKTDNGYFYNEEYGKDASANSTANALAAYSAMQNVEKAEEAYAMLCTFESEKTGVFTYGGKENYSATKDALFGMEAFLNSLPACYDGHKYTQKFVAPTCTQEGYTLQTCSVCKAENKINIIKATGHNFGTNSPKCLICGAVNPSYVVPQATGLKVKSYSTSSIRLTWDRPSGIDEYALYLYNDTAKRYEKIAAVSSDKTSYKVSKLKAGAVYKFRVAAIVDGKEGKKSNYIKAATRPKMGRSYSKSYSYKKITVKLASATCTGYQVQWSTNKSFTTNYKTSTFYATTKTKTIKTAQSKKTYYVRVRNYTKVNGVKIYGKWSAVNTVKTK